MAYPGCVTLSQQAGELLAGTAPERAASWLLIEHPGPWPARGVPAPPTSALGRIAQRADAAGVRLQLIRRTADRRPVPPHVVFLAHTTGERPWLRRVDLVDLRELLDLDLAAFAAGTQPALGRAVAEPLLLVCTHGRREVCCARYGRPTAVAMADQFGAAVWETSHVGGDRFAGNVVCLPYGSYHGRVSAADAATVGGACLRGMVTPEHYRGRSGWPAAAQAADCHARRVFGVPELSAVRLGGVAAGADGITEVGLWIRGRLTRALVRPKRLGRTFPSSCSAATASDPLIYQVEELAPLADDLSDKYFR